MKKIIAILFIIFIAFGLFYVVLWLGKETDFDSKEYVQNNSPNITAKLEDNIPKDAAMILVDNPKANEIIKSPLSIKGEARGSWFFEGIFTIILTDNSGNVLATTTAQSIEDWMTTAFVPFEAQIVFDPGSLGEGVLVFEKNNPSGDESRNESYSLPIFFENGNSTTIQVFFGNSKFDPSQKNCHTVYAVNREVEKIPRIGQSAIEQLLKGPTDKEKEEGYFTSIQDGTELNGISIQHGVAFVDFNKKLDENVAGSCLVISIRSQIEETLRQFPNVEEVQIYIGERSEDVLNP